MTARRDRVIRLTEMAAENERRAVGRLQEAARRVSAVDRRRTAALEGAARLAGPDVPLGLRGHLSGAGARHLLALADEKGELVVEVDTRRSELDEAMTKLRSLERLVERIERAERDRHRRREAAELQDLVAIRAAKGARGTVSGNGTAR